MKTQAKSSIEWDQLDLAPEVKIQVESLVESLLAQAQDKIKHPANEIKQLEEKNQALVYELAHLRRMRYGSKSEAMSAIQLSLLDEDYQADVAAIEAEIDQLPLSQPKKPKRVRAGRQPLPDH